MENKKLGILVVAALIFGIFGGYFFGSKGGYSSGYETARVEIKQRLVESQVVEPTPEEVMVISGTIKSIGSDRFTIESRIPYDPTLGQEEQNSYTTRTVLVGSATEIFIRKVEVNNATTNPGQPVRPFVTRNDKVALSALKADDQVVVQSGENIANKTEFTATTVIMNSK
jgi:hypothetical protein